MYTCGHCFLNNQPKRNYCIIFSAFWKLNFAQKLLLFFQSQHQNNHIFLSLPKQHINTYNLFPKVFLAEMLYTYERLLTLTTKRSLEMSVRVALCLSKSISSISWLFRCFIRCFSFHLAMRLWWVKSPRGSTQSEHPAFKPFN